MGDTDGIHTWEATMNPAYSSSPMKMIENASPKPEPATLAEANQIRLYLNKYLEVASGNRVKLVSMYYGPNQFFRFGCVVCKDNWNMGAHHFPTATSLPSELTDWVMKHRHVCQNYYGQLKKCGICDWPWEQHQQAQPQYVMGSWVAPTPPWEAAEKLYGQAAETLAGFTGYVKGSVPATTAPPAGSFGMTGPFMFTVKSGFPSYPGMPPTEVWQCDVCGREMTTGSGSHNVCPACVELAKRAKSVPPAVKAVEGRMFRASREEKKSLCESSTDINETK
jgi:hypothetical protein